MAIFKEARRIEDFHKEQVDFIIFQTSINDNPIDEKRHKTTLLRSYSKEERVDFLTNLFSCDKMIIQNKGYIYSDEITKIQCVNKSTKTTLNFRIRNTLW